VQFFVDVLGCEPFHSLGPFQSDGDWMQTHLNVHPRAVMKRAALPALQERRDLRGIRVRLPDQNRRQPKNSDVGGHHIALYVDDIHAAIAYLRRRACGCSASDSAHRGPERRADLGLFPDALGISSSW